MFLAWTSFFLTFAVVRLITHAIRAHVAPFHNLAAGGVHIHHLVLGITLLLVTGYLWLRQLGTGTGTGNPHDRLSTLTAIAFGIGAALTLDEFALWLNLQDVYWARQGRQSIDAVLLFGSLLAASIWGGPFLRALIKDVGRLTARKARTTRS